MSRPRHSKLWLYFAGIVFATITAVFLLVTLAWLLLYRLGLLSLTPWGRRAPILLILLGSLMLGAVIAVFVGRIIIHPMQRISDAFDRLSRGDFTVRVPETARLAEMREMEKKFNAMAHDLGHIETLRTDFVANVSHEFKTPLSAIEGYATLLQGRNPAPERQEEYVRKILDNSRKLSTLSSDILMLSKLESQELVAGCREFRLDEQLRRTILLLEERWAARELEFDMDLPRQMYVGNEALLERVWSNLLDNAIKYSPRGGSIRIRMERRGSWLCVTVADDGPGMSWEVQRHMFEKFYQGDPSRQAEGNGLGLALVKRIVDLCRGGIDVDSAPGQGTAFTIRLPLED